MMIHCRSHSEFHKATHTDIKVTINYSVAHIHTYNYLHSEMFNCMRHCNRHATEFNEYDTTYQQIVKVNVPKQIVLLERPATTTVRKIGSQKHIAVTLAQRCRNSLTTRYIHFSTILQWFSYEILQYVS